MKHALVITAAGSSIRLGGIKKEYRILNHDSHITVLSQVLYTFITTHLFSPIIITIPKNDVPIVTSLLEKDLRLHDYSKYLQKNCSFVEGGATRQTSIYNALLDIKQYEPDTVLIHDAARPWVHESIITSVIKKTLQHGAAVPIIASTDTQKEIDSTGKITRHLNRNLIVNVQTPQGFRFNDLLKAHTNAQVDAKEYTDDSEIWGTYIGDVFTVEGSIENKKITFPGDI